MKNNIEIDASLKVFVSFAHHDKVLAYVIGHIQVVISTSFFLHLVFS